MEAQVSWEVGVCEEQDTITPSRSQVYQGRRERRQF